MIVTLPSRSHHGGQYGWPGRSVVVTKVSECPQWKSGGERRINKERKGKVDGTNRLGFTISASAGRTHVTDRNRSSRPFVTAFDNRVGVGFSMIVFYNSLAYNTVLERSILFLCATVASAVAEII